MTKLRCAKCGHTFYGKKHTSGSGTCPKPKCSGVVVPAIVPRPPQRSLTVIDLPAGFVEWVVAACGAALSCPIGRALYVARCKRHTWPEIIVWEKLTAREKARLKEEEPDWDGRLPPHIKRRDDGVLLIRRRRQPTELQLMEHMRHSSAERWLAHWMAGGSTEGIKYKSDAEAIAHINRVRDARLPEGARFRRAIKRARWHGRRHGVMPTTDDETGPSAHFEERPS